MLSKFDQKGLYRRPFRLNALLCGLLAASISMSAPAEQNLDDLYQAFEKYEQYYQAGELEQSLAEAMLAYDLGKQLFGMETHNSPDSFS